MDAAPVFYNMFEKREYAKPLFILVKASAFMSTASWFTEEHVLDNARKTAVLVFLFAAHLALFVVRVQAPDNVPLVIGFLMILLDIARKVATRGWQKEEKKT